MYLKSVFACINLRYILTEAVGRKVFYLEVHLFRAHIDAFEGPEYVYLLSLLSKEFLYHFVQD